MTRKNIFIAIAICLVGVSVAIPMISHNRIQSQLKKNEINLRGIHAGLVLASQGGRPYFVGLSIDGQTVVDSSVEGRFQYLVTNKYVESHHLINPAEQPLLPPQGQLFYSYSLLEIASETHTDNTIRPVSGRTHEWGPTWNSRAAIGADRFIASDNINGQSIWSKAHWKGHVLWNSGHVTWNADPYDDVAYGGVATANDHLFMRSGSYDAYLIHSDK